MASSLVLAINPGSSSVKLAIYDTQSSIIELVCTGLISITQDGLAITMDVAGSLTEKGKVNLPESSGCQHQQAFQWIGNWLHIKGYAEQLGLLCYRVVHGGDTFQKPVPIDDKVIAQLEQLIALAPLHQPLCLQAIKHFGRVFTNAPHWACFDTAFHQSQPRLYRSFALPEAMRQQGIKPYRFHGLSYQSVLAQLKPRYHGTLPERIVIAHLGSGSSLCAIRNGASLATSMTFTPLDGLPMATRCGHIDPAAVIYMIDQLKMTPSAVLHTLNNESGLLGLSGLSPDIRELMYSNTEQALFAVDYYLTAIIRGIGEMTALLRGLDALVFTGGVGTNNAEVRHRISDNLAWLGVKLDNHSNIKQDNVISRQDSPVTVFTLKTDEERLMAENVMALYSQSTANTDDPA